MFKYIKNYFVKILDLILPPRTDFAIVKNLDLEQISHLQRAQSIDGLDWVQPLFSYKENKVRAIIWELKYRENILPIGYIGKLMYEEIVAVISDVIIFNNNAQFLLIPIPITQSRRSERGFNQSELIAKSILENDLDRILIYAPQWFQKIKETPKQSRSDNKAERIKNMVGCFFANPQVDGKYIILIDDVVTTGSTLLEARKTFMESGARDVFAFTIAH